jgi:hypothetical protein
MFNCGNCTAPATCGGGGVANVCGSLADGGVLFDSRWESALGSSDSAIRDANALPRPWSSWADYGGANILTVVAGGPPGYANAMRVQQRGPSFAGEIFLNNFIATNTDYYLRFYMKNDDTSSTEDHIVSTVVPDNSQMIYLRKQGGVSAWRQGTTFDYTLQGYPVTAWYLNKTLTNGAWYRFEFHVHWVDATHITPHIRVYDATGTQIGADADYRQTDYGSSTFNGRSDWTLESYYAAGHTIGLGGLGPATDLRNFKMGNNGQSGAIDTGLYWYYAGVQIRSDTWPGP